MAEPKVNFLAEPQMKFGVNMQFGDKIFLYGQFMDQIWEDERFVNPQYNSVMGYIPVGGYGIKPKESEVVGACLPGFVVDFLSGPSLALPAPFAQEELIDITDILSLQGPELGRVWMPI